MSNNHAERSQYNRCPTAHHISVNAYSGTVVEAHLGSNDDEALGFRRLDARDLP